MLDKLVTQEGATNLLYLSWYFLSVMAESGEKSGSPEMASCPGSSRLESEMREGFLVIYSVFESFEDTAA